MTDREFLIWIYSRLRGQGANESMDFMYKFRAIIAAYPPEKETPSLAHKAKSTLEELQAEWSKNNE